MCTTAKKRRLVHVFEKIIGYKSSLNWDLCLLEFHDLNVAQGLGFLVYCAGSLLASLNMLEFGVVVV